MKISAILASLPRPNPGMHSVNEAFPAWFRSMSIPAETRCYELGKRYVVPGSASSTELCGNLNEAMEADAVLFWGDWMQMRHYGTTLAEADARWRWIDASRTAPGSLTEAEALVRRHLLLAERPLSDLRKTILVGGTLALNSASDFIDGKYAAPLQRLFENASAVLMRDLPSAHIARSLRGDCSDPCLGCDCALLLSPDHLPGFGELPIASENRITLFFGRNLGDRSTRQYAQFSRRVANALEADVSWLPWFPGRERYARSFGRVLRLKEAIRRKLGTQGQRARQDNTALPTLGQLLHAIAQNRCVITDTYHLAVNAWGLGVPAICIADPMEPVSWSANSGQRHTWRDKRFEFFSMIEALPYFVRARELEKAAWKRSRVEQLVELLSSGDEIEALVSARLQTLRETTRSRLRQALTSLSAGR